MEELHFRCPAYLAQKFWLMCNERGDTPGAVLREFMLNEIMQTDSAFEFDLKSVTGLDPWAIREGRPQEQRPDPA